MAVDLERLVVQLSADVKQYNNALNKAMGLTNQRARAVESRFAAMNSRIASSMTGMAGRIGAAFAAAFSARELARLSDTALKIENSLKVTGLAGEELTRVYGSLRDSAMRNYAPLETLATLYSRLGLAQKSLGVSVDEMLNFTDKVALALRVQGTTSEEARGALIQLSQAMGAGIVRAEEFNSIVEGAPSILRAAAAGLKEAGGEVSKLRRLVIDGELSSQAFFRAFEAGAPILTDMVAGANVTLSQAFTNLNSALIDSAKEFNDATEMATRFAGGINNAARAISDFDVSGFIRKIQEAGGALEKFLNDLGSSSYMEQFAEWLTGSELTPGKPISIETIEAEQDLAGLERQIKILEDRINANKEMAIDTSDAEASLNVLLAKANALRTALSGGAIVNDEAATSAINRMVPFSPLGPLPTTARQVSIEDYPVTDAKKKKGGGRSKKDDWQREVQQIKERTAAIQAETAAMAGLNPLIEDCGYTLEKARAKQDLLTAAKRAGLEITPKLEAQIEQLAESYAQASVAAEQLAEAQDMARQAAEDMRDLGKDVMGGFIQDMAAGKSAADALANALGKIGDKLLELAMNNLFGGSGSGGFGILGSLLGIGGGGGDPWSGMRIPGYAKGTRNHPGGLAVVGEKGPELLNLPRGSQVFPQVPSMPRLQAPANQNAQSTTDVRVFVDQDGNWHAAVERISQRNVKAGLAKYDKGSAYRTSRDLRTVSERGYAR